MGLMMWRTRTADARNNVPASSAANSVPCATPDPQGTSRPRSSSPATAAVAIPELTDECAGPGVGPGPAHDGHDLPVVRAVPIEAAEIALAAVWMDEFELRLVNDSRLSAYTTNS